MPVIGKLDEQVDVVLIDPLRRKREIETRKQNAPEPEEQMPTLAEVKKDQDEANADPPLPIWLL
ncbi:MAG: hypothetical protein M3407_12350 [Acidobacteriota bacterium]|nr:hypothetical protein [Acidobacteriota bacterium]